MNGAIIQERNCPRCAIRRTVRIADSSFCHNCRLQWHQAPNTEFLPRPTVTYAFTGRETARLMIYRAAIRAAFTTSGDRPARLSLATRELTDVSLIGYMCAPRAGDRASRRTSPGPRENQPASYA